MPSRWFLFVVSFVCALSSLQFCDLSAQELADVIEKCERSVVKIKVDSKQGESIGSGFVVASSGMLVTNVHVLAGAKEATATFNTGESYKITGTYYFDESRDICVAQLDGKGFTPIEVDENLPRKGDKVIALGAPRGLDFTATTGIVSAVREGRLLDKELRGDWIQVDAALSPGNSGGPLVNTAGDVVGMSTLASRGDSQNLNFGISCADILDAVDAASEESLAPFRDGIADVKTRGGVGGGGGAVPEPRPLPTSRPDVPEGKVDRFVKLCAEQYSSLYELTMDRAKIREKRCRMMMRGRIKPLFFGGMEFVKGTRGRPDRVIYSNEGLKQVEVRKAKAELSAIEKFKSEVGEECTEESLLSLLNFAESAVDLKKAGAVGVLRNCTADKIPNDNIVEGTVTTERLFGSRNMPFPVSTAAVIWMASTERVLTDKVVDPMIVFVAEPLNRESVDVEVDGVGMKLRMTNPAILVEIEKSELKKSIKALGLKRGGPATKPGDEMRQWTAGKYNVMASVVSWDYKSVTLQKENGKQTTVKRSILSKSDNEFLDGLKK